jgi:pyruvate/2-oxoglutarate dehydrogenase complex dihydrolipoamide acyltransferase (E2) component
MEEGRIAQWLRKEGDAVKVEIEKLGHIENHVVPEKADTVIG